MQEDFDGTIVKDEKWPQRGDIEFGDVELRYRPTTEIVLKGLNLSI